MSIHLNYDEGSLRHSDVVIETLNGHWVIPYDCELLKMLLEHQKIKAADLYFNSAYKSHCFAKRLFLLALDDECKSQQPSKLAEFARELVTLNINLDDQNGPSEILKK